MPDACTKSNVISSQQSAKKHAMSSEGPRCFAFSGIMLSEETNVTNPRKPTGITMRAEQRKKLARSFLPTQFVGDLNQRMMAGHTIHGIKYNITQLTDNSIKYQTTSGLPIPKHIFKQLFFRHNDALSNEQLRRVLRFDRPKSIQPTKRQ